MYTYNSRTAEFRRDGVLISTDGYSGHGAGRNNPDMEKVHDLGPTPRALFTMRRAPKHPHLGEPILELIPDHDVGRPGLLMHGDDAEHDASKGCMIQRNAVRVYVVEHLAEDDRLAVQ